MKAVTMLLKPLAFATAASAFLLAPAISEADRELVDGIVTMLPVESESFAPAKSPESWSVKVPYTQSKTGDGYLQFDLVAEEGAKLTANGFELYPNADPWSVDLTANVVNANGKGKTKEETLGYSMAVKPVATDAYQDMDLIEVQLRVIEVGNRFVTGIPAVKIQLIRAITGDIAIANVEVDKAPGARCSSIVCRAKEEFFEALKSFKGCMGRLRHNGHQKLAAAKAEAQQDGAGAALNNGDHSGHHDKRPHGHRHNWRLLLKNIASHVFLPVLMGITAGVGVAVYVFPS